MTRWWSTLGSAFANATTTTSGSSANYAQWATDDPEAEIREAWQRLQKGQPPRHFGPPPQQPGMTELRIYKHLLGRALDLYGRLGMPGRVRDVEFELLEQSLS